MYEHIDYTKIPQHMRESVYKYINEGVPPGTFLRAVLENDLVNAFVFADDINKKVLNDWVSFVWWDLPVESWGSREKVNLWMKRRQHEFSLRNTDTAIEDRAREE